MPKYHFNIKQGTPEWYEVRFGRFGSTGASEWLVKGNEIGKGLESTIYQKCADAWLNEIPTDSGFTSYAMEWGNKYEPVARVEYEIQKNVTVKEVGYVSEGHWLGYSPDGLVDDAGLIEIKCPQGKEFIRYKKTGYTINPKHIAQMQWGMWVTKREFCDYIVYHPVGGLIIQRIDRDYEMQTIFEKKLHYVLEEIKEIESLFK